MTTKKTTAVKLASDSCWRVLAGLNRVLSEPIRSGKISRTDIIRRTVGAAVEWIHNGQAIMDSKSFADGLDTITTRCGRVELVQSLDGHRTYHELAAGLPGQMQVFITGECERLREFYFAEIDDPSTLDFRAMTVDVLRKAYRGVQAFFGEFDQRKRLELKRGLDLERRRLGLGQVPVECRPLTDMQMEILTVLPVDEYIGPTEVVRRLQQSGIARADKSISRSLASLSKNRPSLVESREYATGKHHYRRAASNDGVDL